MTAGGTREAVQPEYVKLIKPSGEVSEQWTTPIDNMATRLGGIVFRRGKGDIQNDSWFDADYADYLYPYDYDPVFA